MIIAKCWDEGLSGHKRLENNQVDLDAAFLVGGLVSQTLPTFKLWFESKSKCILLGDNILGGTITIAMAGLADHPSPFTLFRTPPDGNVIPLKKKRPSREMDLGRFCLQ